MSLGFRFMRRLSLGGFLDFIEKAGNKLPHPATLFALLAATVVAASWVFASLNYVAVHPSTGEAIHAVNLLSGAGLRRLVTGLVTNFTGFAPLGTVLVAMLGVGVAEGSGLIPAALRALVLSAPRRLVTLVVVFGGVMSNAASEAGYVILIPLAGVIFQAFGRHPLAGMAAAFAGVSGGYSANLVLGSVDPLLAGITTEMARIIDPAYTVNPACNYYFMAASTVLITLLGTLVTERIVERRLGRYEGAPVPMEQLGAAEKKGLWAALAAGAALAAVVAWMTVPQNGILRDPQTGSLLHSPFLSGIVAIIFVAFFVPGLAYGVATRSIQRDADVVKMMGTTMSGLGTYIVLVFAAAQFVALFSWTHVGVISAIKGAELLKAVGLTGIPLVVSFVFVSGLLNLLMGSASAKWAIMAPVFVPMFMLLGYTPELTQAAYRIGDSSTNVITPMMSYFALILAFVQKYRKDAGIGTVVALMLPYSVAFLLVWVVFLVGWMMLGLPLGPGAGLRL